MLAAIFTVALIFIVFTILAFVLLLRSIRFTAS